ncbi:LysM peptidoglycan-binding domain-containing protein [Paenibacillus oralis]|uniref:LysM peptidoglycan-binding domain-containing protein n=1 Tax=Paenibacillus oralis TaxID=2490856 RepID=A0A3P3U6H6_9BACL|nr:3D domain-containing protein [Paenibacillus oralis]RRJ65875.1 LysM peptidoglycan-binding domain-containing protein [Paenibacillus oralis]
MRNRIFTKIAKTTLVAASLAAVLQTVPVHAEAVHTAVEGDTFYLLAKKYRIGLEQLMNANKGIDPGNIYEGLKLTIPGTEAPEPQAPAAKTMKAEAVSGPNVLSTDKVVEAWGKTFNYSRTVQVKASAYSAAADENGKWGAVDYFGNPLKLGTIAVDPNVIPMGTKVLVTGYDHEGLPKQAFVATASDQGGAIKGKRIDIFIPGSKSAVMTFGFQDVTLYVLK